MTWAELVRQEPYLTDLEREVKAIRPKGQRFCANDVWYGHAPWPGIKPRLGQLVGWGAANPALRTSEAYDVAYDHLYHLLPDCRDCLCL